MPILPHILVCFTCPLALFVLFCCMFCFALFVYCAKKHQGPCQNTMFPPSKLGTHVCEHISSHFPISAFPACSIPGLALTFLPISPTLAQCSFLLGFIALNYNLNILLTTPNHYLLSVIPLPSILRPLEGVNVLCILLQKVCFSGLLKLL